MSWDGAARPGGIWTCAEGSQRSNSEPMASDASMAATPTPTFLTMVRATATWPQRARTSDVKPNDNATAKKVVGSLELRGVDTIVASTMSAPTAKAISAKAAVTMGRSLSFSTLVASRN